MPSRTSTWKIVATAAAEARIDPDGAWVLRGDRGVSYSAKPPEGAVITEGAWWAQDYTGEPLVSFAQHEAEELGLGLGSTITVNVLGRPITARTQDSALSCTCRM